MGMNWKTVELVAMIETSGNGAIDELAHSHHVRTCTIEQLATACLHATRRSKAEPTKTIMVLSWSLDRGTQLEYAVIGGEPLNYYPHITRETPIRWNAVLAPVVEQYLSTLLRSEIPVDPPQGFSADVDANADTDDAIESPFLGEIK